MIVLKIILMILGILLGILLLLLLAVLFVPIRYKAAGEVLEDTSVKAKVTWLLSAVGVHVSYDKEQDLKVWLRIFFWKKMLYEGEASEAEEEVLEEEVLESESLHEAEDAIEDEAPKDTEDDQTEDDRKVAEDIDAKSGQDKEPSGEVESFGDDSEDDDSKDSRSASNKKVKKDASDEERTSDKNRKEKPGENIRRMIDRIKAFHYDDRDKAALSHIKDELIKLLKHLCPTKSRLDLKYSTGSPDTTGISLGVIAMFPIAYKNKWNIVPDFEAEEAYGKGSGWLKGRIYVYYLLLILLRLYRDKNCYRLYRKIKRF